MQSVICVNKFIPPETATRAFGSAVVLHFNTLLSSPANKKPNLIDGNIYISLCLMHRTINVHLKILIECAAHIPMK